MFRKYAECEYAGKRCFVRRYDGSCVVIMTCDGLWAKQHGGWEQVDKFEWEKTVSRDKIQILGDSDDGLAREGTI